MTRYKTGANNLSRARHATVALICAATLLLTTAAASAAVTTSFSGKPRVISTAKKISGEATGDPLQTAHSGQDFHIIVTGLPSDHALQLELGFAELEDKAPGQRMFNVEVNDKRALSGFDVSQAAGGIGKSVVKRFTITPTDGRLDFHFTGTKGNALINYIQISGNGVKTLITAPAEKSATASADDDDYIPADSQAAFDAEAGVINLDGLTETWNSGVPIGGIGTGKFELLPNGQFGNFTISNSWDLPVLRPRGTFLAIAAKATSGRGGARLLQVSPSDQRGNKIYPDYTAMSSGKYTGEFPAGKLQLEDEKLPLKVTVEGWSPLVPHDVANSSLPAGVIGVTVENPQKYPVSVGVAFSWEDISGRGGSLLPNDQHGFVAPSMHEDVATTGVTGIRIASTHSAQDRAATFTGDYFLGTPIQGAVITRTLAWNPRTNAIPWWKNFTRRLRLERIPTTAGSTSGNKDGEGPMASVLCVSFNLAPKEVRRVPFIVSWYTPKIITLDSTSGHPSEENPNYASRFKSSVEVASYLAEHRHDLRKKTDEWVDMIKRATVPQWLKTHALNSLFPIRSNSIYLKNERFAMLESPADMKGMLGAVDLKLGATDFLLTMFPTLERTELNLYARAQDASGRIPRYVGNIHGALAGFDTALLGTQWYDPTASWLLEVARYWRETGDEPTREALKPAVTKAHAYLTAQIESSAPAAETNIFGQLGHYPGASLMSRIKAVAALDAAQALLGDPAPTDAARNAELQRINLDETTATFSAVLAGEYAARNSGLHGVLTPEQVSSTLSKISTDNYKPSRPVPLMEAPANATSMSAPAPLQAYVGAMALQSENPELGLEAYKRMFQVAYGAQKAPWKQALLYDVPAAAKPTLRYHRSAMSAWSVWRGLSGVVYDQPNHRLLLNPVAITTATADMELPVFTPDFWAWLKYNVADSTGTLSITRLISETTPTLAGIATSLNADGTPENLVTFDEPLMLETGATLQIKGWPSKPGGTISPEAPEIPESLDEQTTGSVVAGQDDSGTSESPHVSQSSPDTAEGEEMTTEAQSETEQ